MNVAATSTRAADAAALRSSSLADRLLAAVPLATVYVWLSGIYAVEAWRRSTPWLFTDELETSTLSRSIAYTGHPARLGQPHSFESLYTYVTAPMWRFSRVATAYAGIKYLDVLLMTAVVFPTYLLARTIVGRRAALFAAAGAGAIPSLAYSSYIVQETISYPYAALCLFLIAKALRAGRPVLRSRWAWAATLFSLVAPAVKGELVVIPIGFALAVLFMWWSGEAMRRRRTAWSPSDFLAVAAIAAGAIIVVSGVASHRSAQWLSVTAYNWTKKRIFVYGDWAAGSLAIGLGVVPFLLGLTALIRPAGETRSVELRAFRSVATSALVAFGVYAGMKAAYLSETFETRVEERNLIYIAPVLFVGTALVLERRRIRPWALAASAAYTFYLVVGTPYFMDRQLYSDALGLAILEQANRYLLWTPNIAQWVMIGISVGGTIATVALVRLRRAAAGAALVAVLGGGTIGWCLTGEIAAAAGTNSVAAAAASTLRHPFDWVDSRTHGARTLYLGQGVGDPDAPELLEFWNPSILRLATLDGSFTGPLAGGSPQISTRGELLNSNYSYVVEDWPCIDFAGSKTWRHSYRAGGTFRQWRLVQLYYPPKLKSYCTGIYPDGWTGKKDSTYFRFSRSARGWLRVVVSRKDWSGKTGPSPFSISTGEIVIGRDLEPAIGRVRRTYTGTIDSVQTKTIWIPTPATAFAAKVVIAKKFVPRDYDPVHLSDARVLGAEVTYRFFKTRPSATRHRRG